MANGHGFEHRRIRDLPLLRAVQTGVVIWSRAATDLKGGSEYLTDSQNDCWEAF